MRDSAKRCAVLLIVFLATMIVSVVGCDNSDDNNEKGPICVDADADGIFFRDVTNCPDGEDYCDDDPANSSVTDCTVCIDIDNDLIGIGGGCTGMIDCDDSDAEVFPGAEENGNIKDYNCNGLIDDADGDQQRIFPYGPDCDDDGDGHLQYICGGNDIDDSNPEIYKSSGTGTFSTIVRVKVERSPESLAAGDFDGDGHLDLAIKSEQDIPFSSERVPAKIVMMKNDGSGQFEADGEYETGPSPWEMTTADLNGDGMLDLFTTVSYADDGDRIGYHQNMGDGSMSGESFITFGDRPKGLAFQDFDGDGDLDLASTSDADNILVIFINEGNGELTQSQEIEKQHGTTDIFAGDLDGDGDIDLAISNWPAGYLSLFFNDGSGIFSEEETVISGGESGAIAGFDYDLDGDIDLVLSNFTITNLDDIEGFEIYSNDGAGNFTKLQKINTEFPSWWIETGDINGDGYSDLVGTTSFGIIFTVINNGDGTFGAPVRIDIENEIDFGLVLADFNEDGALDIAVGESSSLNNNISILFGDR